MAKNARAMVGTRTPAQALSMCRSSSWRLRKYQGALDGLGVTFRLARLRSGALMKTERGGGGGGGGEGRGGPRPPPPPPHPPPPPLLPLAEGGGRGPADTVADG